MRLFRVGLSTYSTVQWRSSHIGTPLAIYSSVNSALPLASILAVVLSAPAFFAQEPAIETVEGRDIRAFSQRTGHRPVWIDAQGHPTEQAWTVLARLRAAGEDGLDADDYGGTALEYEAKALGQDVAQVPAGAVAFDEGLTASALRFLRDLHLGRVDPRELGMDLDHPVEPHDFAALLESATAGRSFDSIVADLRPRLLHYSELKQMLVKYRSSNPVRARQIELTMERLRWLPDLHDQRLIVVNLPMFHVWGWDVGDTDGVPAIDMAVIIGRADAGKTPVFVSRVADIVLNPYWNVPDSIARNEILPKLARNRNYLARNHMEMTSDGGGRRIRQLPGPWNALGRIKFEFPNNFNVYLHDTPARRLFRRARRDFSHGCIRVEDPLALAEWVLIRQGEWSRARILAAIGGGSTRRVPVAEPPQILMLYLTAMFLPGENEVRFADDIYGHDARLDAWLRARTGE